MNPWQGVLTIILSLIMAMVLAVLHLPDAAPEWLGWLRPSWIVLVLFYWVIELPQRIGILRAWVLGLCIDVLLGEPLGVNAVCLAALTYSTGSFYERLRMYSLAQQSAVIFLIVLIIELFKNLLWIQFLNADFHAAFLWGPLTSALMWPFVYQVLRLSSRPVSF